MPDAVVERLDGPSLTRSLTLRADSIIDENERRVRLSFSSTEPYTRSSWFDDPWVEILGHDEGEVDLSRLNTGGAPLLYVHNSYSRNNHIGVVERAWVEGNKGYAEVRLSKRADVDDIWQDMRDGILTNVSVGYRILERTLLKKNSGSPDEYRVTRWMPMEVSLVPMPADHTVGVGRAAEQQTDRNFVITTVGADAALTRNSPDEESTMPNENTGADDVIEEQRTAQEPATPPVDTDAIRREAIEQEQVRANQIRTLVRQHNLGEQFADELVSKGVDIDKARAAVLDKLVDTQTPETRSHHDVRVGQSGQERFRADAVNALLARSQVEDFSANNPLRGYSLFEIARRTLEMAGVSTNGLDKMALVGRAFTQSNSDFPVLLENAMYKAMQSAYKTQSDTWSRFCATGSVSDFRAHNRYRLGSFGNLDSLNELGEFKNKTIPDGEKSSVSIGTKGNLINISRQAIINDDLGAFLQLSMWLARAARRSIEADVYAVLAENGGLGPTMSDSYTLFHANHNNLGTGAAISVESIDADRVVMASQKDVSGNDFLDLRPSILLLPISLGGTARVINNAQYDPDTSNKLQKPNKVQNLFSDIVDSPRLAGTRRYMFSSPTEAPVLEVNFLDGQDEPFLDRMDGWTVDGVQFKARLDYGVNVIDYRGAVTNAGTA